MRNKRRRRLRPTTTFAAARGDARRGRKTKRAGDVASHPSHDLYMSNAALTPRDIRHTLLSFISLRLSFSRFNSLVERGRRVPPLDNDDGGVDTRGSRDVFAPEMY